MWLSSGLSWPCLNSSYIFRLLSSTFPLPHNTIRPFVWVPGFLINLITEAMQRKLLHPRSVASESWVSSPTFLRHYMYSQVCTSSNAPHRHAAALPVVLAQIHFTETWLEQCLLFQCWQTLSHSACTPTTYDSTVLNKTNSLWSPALESHCISLHNLP